MIFNFSDENFIFPVNGNTGMDTDGNIHVRMTDNTSMNLGTGGIDFTSTWKNDDMQNLGSGFDTKDFWD